MFEHNSLEELRNFVQQEILTPNKLKNQSTNTFAKGHTTVCITARAGQWRASGKRNSRNRHSRRSQSFSRRPNKRMLLQIACVKTKTVKQQVLRVRLRIRGHRRSFSLRSALRFVCSASSTGQVSCLNEISTLSAHTHVSLAHSDFQQLANSIGCHCSSFALDGLRIRVRQRLAVDTGHGFEG